VTTLPPNFLATVPAASGGDVGTPALHARETVRAMRVSKQARARPAGRTRCLAVFAVLAAAALAPAAATQTMAQPATGGPPAQPAPVAAAPVGAAPAPQAQGAPTGFPAQPPPTYRPGFIAEFGRWWDETRGKLDNPKDAADATQDAMRNAAEATKHAMTAIVQFPATRMVELHAHCELAPNGAPDCRRAAANACRAKGFSSGDPINVRSSENCPASVALSGRQPRPGECPTETVVLAAACH
jgi:hypothetical protein